MILITTPTGDIGARVLLHVLDAGQTVRIIVRDASKLDADLAGRIDVIEGSHGDDAIIGPALKGVESVFWLPPGDPTLPNAEMAYVNFSQPFCEALMSSDVTHVVGVSALGRGWPKPSGLAGASIAMDDLIGKTGVAYRALACTSLMDNLLRQVGPIRENGMFYAPTPGDFALPHVAKSDVAAIAARLLVSSDWHGVSDVPLYGPDDLTFHHMAEIMSDVLGKPIQFAEMTMDQFDAMLRSLGTSDGMANDYIAMMTAKNEGLDRMVPGSSRHDTPTTFRMWCENELHPAIAGL